MSLAIDNLTSGYGKTIVLWDVNFEIEPGSITCLLGLNGVGKTTLTQNGYGLAARSSWQHQF